MMWHQLILWPFLSGIVCLAAAVGLGLELARKNRGNATMVELSRTIRAGTLEFMKRLALPSGILILSVFLLIDLAQFYWPQARLDWSAGVAFLIGALVTALAAAIGLICAGYANSRTAEAARLGGMSSALNVAMSGGAVMGLCVTGLALIGLSAILFFFPQREIHLFAFALGSSATALLLRLAGGIFTKAADIGADIITRTEPGFSENDPRNAAVATDSVGDNIGNVAGIGANLMESIIEAIVAAMVIAYGLRVKGPGAIHDGLVMLPLLVAATGALSSLAGIIFIRSFVRNNLQGGLTMAVLLSAALTLAGTWFLVEWLGEAYASELPRADCTRLGIFLSLIFGFAAGGLISLFSEYYTSFRYRPTRRIGERSQFGTVLTVLEGLSVGSRSAGMLTVILAGTIALAWREAEFYGITMAAAGMLAVAGMVITLNAFGPIIDNAGGIAEMARMDRSVRDIMENLHAISNVIAAMGKGLANCCAAMVALGLLAALIRYSGLAAESMALGRPAVLAGLLLGAMFPVYLSALMFRAVGSSATVAVEEVRRQLREIPGLREGKMRPDYARCNERVARRAVRGMFIPAALTIAAPLVAGLVFGKAVLVAFLAGALVCGLVLGFQMVNAGAAMDNAKKYIEEGYFGGKGSEAHKAAVMGDALGDSFKDTAGPALMVAIKFMCVLALLIYHVIK